MQPSRVARRYAAALFQTARKINEADAVEQDLRDLAAFLGEYPQVLKSLTVPRVPDERKKAVLQSLIGDRMNPLTQRFLDLMVNHGRESALLEAAAAYARLADESRNIVAAEVVSAMPLDDEQTTRLKSKLDGITGKNTRLEISTDPALVGGLVVRIGDTILDGSVRGYLDQFAARLRDAPLTAIRLEDIPAS
jgi:F-type H+-transporting ATPase subunit delta